MMINHEMLACGVTMAHPVGNPPVGNPHLQAMGDVPLPGEVAEWYGLDINIYYI